MKLTKPKTIDLTPSREGYISMLMLIIENRLYRHEDGEGLWALNELAKLANGATYNGGKQ